MTNAIPNVLMRELNGYVSIGFKTIPGIMTYISKKTYAPRLKMASLNKLILYFIISTLYNSISFSSIAFTGQLSIHN